ncbi:MAG: hypothetical protein J5J06_14520 [Phycisphaerae bacterium]|nr:hypothetical protein [Phycisphaerae bacterium]
MKRWVNIHSGPVAWLIYVLVRCVIALMQCFPIEWNLHTARLLARCWAAIMPRHRERAVQHLRMAYGSSLPHGDIERLADACLASTTMFAVEVLCMPRRITASTWARYVRLVNFEGLLEQIVSGRGCILVTGHYGSFELLGHVMAALGLPVTAVMRPLDNKYLNGWLVRTRRLRGLELLDKKGAALRSRTVLENGGMIGFIGDQDAGRKGVFVDFFGHAASTYKSIGLLAMATRRPVAIGCARRVGWKAQYDFVVQRVIMPEEWEAQDDPLRWITQAYTAGIEQFVREAPGQYLWIHRRWKTRPKAERSGRN